MPSFEETLLSRLQDIRDAGLYRELRRLDSPQGPRIQINGRSLVNFSSNDYLGLANHPDLVAASTRALRDYGAGSGASRLICGSLAPHHDLEESLAAFKNTPAALVFSTGFATALGAIQSLLSRDDILIIDKLVHACIVDAARLSPAKLRVYAHNDLNDLERILQWATRKTDARSAPPRILIATESVFSMDGDLAPLREIVQLKNQYGAWLMLDEAHATGLFGDHRRGLAEAFGLADQVEIHMGTLGKALGASGGYICGSRPLIDLLINQARTFIFSTAPPPANSAAALAALRLLQAQEGHDRRKSLWILVDRVKALLLENGWTLPAVQSPIIPLHVGDEKDAVDLSTRLRDRGVLLPAIRYPTVARGKARLRLTITAAHRQEHLDPLRHGLQNQNLNPSSAPPPT